MTLAIVCVLCGIWIELAEIKNVLKDKEDEK